jgi:hypothetical protein
MLTPALIEKEFVPYNRRAALKHNAVLLTKSGSRGRNASRVVLQGIDQCSGAPNCTPCGFGGRCYHGYCVYNAPGCP